MKALRGLHLHFEPSSGIAGDMAVAALVDLGVPATVVTTAVKAMGVRGLRVAFGKRKRGAFVGKSFDVTWPGQNNHEHARPRKPPSRLTNTNTTTTTITTTLTTTTTSTATTPRSNVC